MPNFAQQCPLLLFMPLLIFAAIALAAGMVHLAILLDARIKFRRAAIPAKRRAVAAIIPRLLDPPSRPQPAAKAKLRLVSTKF